MTEAQLHSSVVQYLRAALPSSAVLHHSMNEGRRGWKAQRQLKTHGVQAGWPDLEIIHAGEALFIELKSARGRLTRQQIETHHRLGLAGAKVAVCRSLDDVEAFLAQHMTLKARAA